MVEHTIDNREVAGSSLAPAIARLEIEVDKQTSQRWLDRLYTVRDFFVGWCFRRIKTYQDFERYATTPWRTWVFWMLRMRYIFDDKDRASSPEETWARGGGDCEDMAWFCRDHLRKLGYEAEMLRAKWDTPDERGISAHVTCVFRTFGDDDDNWGYMGTGPTEYSGNGFCLRRIANRMVGSNALEEYGIVDVAVDGRLWYFDKDCGWRSDFK